MSEPQRVEVSTILDRFIQSQQDQLNLVRLLISTIRESQRIQETPVDPEELTSLEDVADDG